MALLLVLLAAGGVAAQKPTTLPEEDLNRLQVPVEGADLEVSFRCGVFYLDPNEPSPEDGGKPAAPLLILNRTWSAEDECPDGDYGRYETFCNSIWTRVSDGGILKLTSPSLSKKRAAEGTTIGGDICEHLKNRLKAPYVGKNSKKFPDGIKFGMYSNACGVPKWTYTGRTHFETVCCVQGVHEDCATNLGRRRRRSEDLDLDYQEEY